MRLRTNGAKLCLLFCFGLESQFCCLAVDSLSIASSAADPGSTRRGSRKTGFLSIVSKLAFAFWLMRAFARAP